MDFEGPDQGTDEPSLFESAELGTGLTTGGTT